MGFASACFRRTNPLSRCNDPVQGWVATIGLLGLNGEDMEVAGDFEKYSIKCHFCGSIKHLLGDCQSFFTLKTSIKRSKGLYNQQVYSTGRREQKAVPK